MNGTTHEDFTRGTAPKGSSDRSFGFVFVAVFAILGLAPLRRHGEVRVWALAIAAVLFIVSLAIPRVLRPANQLWTKLSLVLNTVVSPVAMGAIFFLVATPIGILMRWTSKDSLRLRTDAGADTYWRSRTPPGPDPKTMSHQF